VGVMHEAIEHGGGENRIGKHLPPASNGLVEVTMNEPRSEGFEEVREM